MKSYILGVLMLCGCNVASPDPSALLRSEICTVWVVTNCVTGEVRFAANALDTGYVPKSGEHSFETLDSLAIAIDTGVFGKQPRVLSRFDGDPEYQDGYGVRALTESETNKLKALGIRLQNQ